jgi:hypothetical protein
MLIRQNGGSIYLTKLPLKGLYSGEPAEVALGMKSGCAILFLEIGFRLFYVSLFHQPGVDHFLLESPLIAYFERRYFLLGD